MSYRYFIYDLDGTLVDTSPGILSTLRETEKLVGVEPLPEETLKRFIGPPLEESFVMFHKADPQLCQKMLATYRERYVQGGGIRKARVYDGVVEGLNWIHDRGGKTAVATLKQERMAVLTLEAFGLLKEFDHLAGPGPNKKPNKAALVLECLEKLGCGDKGQAVLFGDSRYDGVGAMEAGIDFVPLTYGFGFADPGSLDGIPYVAKATEPRELLEFIKGSI